MNKLTKHNNFPDLKLANTLTKVSSKRKYLKTTADLEDFFSALQKKVAKSRKNKISKS